MRRRVDHHRPIVVRPVVEGLEGRQLLSGRGLVAAAETGAVLTTSEVNALLDRAQRASASQDAIIAVVDRAGNILGVRVENGVDAALLADPATKTFAIDGAVAKARTGAFFANNAAPLTSRTVQLISQTTMTQREIQSSPDVVDPNSPAKGPGFVAPVGLKGHFPPGVQFTPQVDLFAIEHTNRDSILHRDAAGNLVILPSRFNIPAVYDLAGKGVTPPESYGLVSGIDPQAQSRGIATLPGGMPLFRNGQLVGGIGVFFPGKTGYATEENSQLNDAGFYNPRKRDRSQEAEYMAFAAAGGSQMAGGPIHGRQLPGVPNLPAFNLPFGRIDLVGITLDLFGGHGLQGPKNLVSFGKTLGFGQVDTNDNEPIDTSGDTLKGGVPVASGWLVPAHDGVGITAAQVQDTITRGISEANIVRAAIRTPLDSTARMVFAVADRDGNIVGLYRMPDATVFSIAVAVAKARNVNYYNDAAKLQSLDKISNVPAGTAFTARTFRYVALPRFPEGIDGYPPGPFSILNDGGVTANGRTQGAPLPPSAFQSVQGYDAFNPQTNFHDTTNVLNQNGIVFFPGSSALYDNTGDTPRLIGGFGVSGDGVDQDDDVTTVAVNNGLAAPGRIRADQVTVRGVRLPYNKFNRQPHEPRGQPPDSNARVIQVPIPVGPKRKKA